jgi:hypothetical protein
MLSNPLVRLLGYLFFISPPKALDIVKNHSAEGELKNVPVWMVVLLEGLIRIGLLLITATFSQEFLLGKEYYERMQLDYCLAVIVCVGIIHFSIYYLLVVCCISRPSFLRLYRLLRNLGYASLTGLPFFALGQLAISESWLNLRLEEYLLQVSIMTSVVFALVGAIEAIVSRRMPLGLDSRLDK